MVKIFRNYILRNDTKYHIIASSTKENSMTVNELINILNKVENKETEVVINWPKKQFCYEETGKAFYSTEEDVFVIRTFESEVL